MISLFFVLRRPFVKCFARLSQLLGVSSRYCFPVILKLAGLAFLFRLGVLFKRNLVLCFTAFSKKKEKKRCLAISEDSTLFELSISS